MKILKIILAIVLTYAFIKSGIDLCMEEPENSIMYIIIVLIFLLIPIYLFYSATKETNKDISNLEKKENEKINNMN